MACIPSEPGAFRGLICFIASKNFLEDKYAASISLSASIITRDSGTFLL